MDSMVFAEEAIDSRSPGLYYLIHWKREIHAENIWELVEGITHLRRLLKKYQSENSDKPTATSPLIDKSTSPPPMAARSGAKVAPPIILRKCTLAKNHQPIHNCTKPPVQVRQSGRCQQPTSRF